MTRGTILIILGVLVALSLFSGLPLSWLEIIIPILGLVIAFIGYLMRPRHSAVSTVVSIETTA